MTKPTQFNPGECAQRGPRPTEPSAAAGRSLAPARSTDCAFSFNLEGAGDVVELNLASFVVNRLKRGVEASLEDDREIQEAFEAVRANLRSAASVFTTGDKRAARVLSQQKAEFRRREGEAVKTHFARLRQQRQATAPS